MENTELKEKYCREFGYGYFNKHNENEYTKWLESELLKALKQVKNNGVLDDVISCLPTDVEISDYSKQKYLYRKSPCGTYYEGKQKGFYEGAEWLKDKINGL